MNFRTLAIAVAASAGAVALVACSSEKPAAPSSSAAKVATPAATIPATLFVAEAPADAAAITKARTSAKAGDSVVLTGFIGGRVDPFTAGRAMFVMADPEQTPACTDHCETPWDACCEPKDKIAAGTATVQVVDEKGEMLKADLNGVGELKPGSTVTVAGVVRTAEAGAFVVDAKSIYVSR